MTKRKVGLRYNQFGYSNKDFNSGQIYVWVNKNDIGERQSRISRQILYCRDGRGKDARTLDGLRPRNPLHERSARPQGPEKGRRAARSELVRLAGQAAGAREGVGRVLSRTGEGSHSRQPARLKGSPRISCVTHLTTGPSFFGRTIAKGAPQKKRHAVRIVTGGFLCCRRPDCSRWGYRWSKTGGSRGWDR